jgi:hypothetical protein
MDMLTMVVMFVLKYQANEAGKVKDKLLKAKPRNIREALILQTRLKCLDEELDRRLADIEKFRKAGYIKYWFGMQLGQFKRSLKKKHRKKKTGP